MIDTPYNDDGDEDQEVVYSSDNPAEEQSQDPYREEIPEEEGNKKKDEGGLADTAGDYLSDKFQDKLNDKLMSKLSGEGAGAGTSSGAAAEGGAGASGAAGGAAGGGMTAGATGATSGSGVAAGAGGFTGSGAVGVAGGGTAGGGVAAAGVAGAPETAGLSLVAAAALAVAAKKAQDKKKKQKEKGGGVSAEEKTGATGCVILLGACTCCSIFFVGPFLFVLALIFGLFGLIGAPGPPKQSAPGSETNFATVEKKVSIPSLSLGPSQIVSMENQSLGTSAKFDVKIKATIDLSGLDCTDEITLAKAGGVTQSITLPASPNCPDHLDAGQEFNFSFNLNLPQEELYKDSAITNKFGLNGRGKVSGGGNLDYNIPFRDTGVTVVNETSVRDSVINNSSWPNNFAGYNDFCDPGVTCWDYIKRVAIQGRVNPAFALAIWIAESGASHYPGHLSCPNGGVGLTHTIADLKRSVNCFVNGQSLADIFKGAGNYPDDQFARMLDDFCDPGTEEICQVPPDPVKTFVASLKSWYGNLVPEGSPGAMTTASSGGVTESFTTSASATILIGDAPSSDPSGWPTTGSITQLPYCTYDGNACIDHSNLASVDIGAVLGTPIHATQDGIATWTDDGDAHYGLHVVITGSRYTTFYGHMDRVNLACVPGPVRAGALIGWVDSTGYSTGNHLHYEIRNTSGGQVPLATFNSFVPSYHMGAGVAGSYSGSSC